MNLTKIRYCWCVHYGSALVKEGYSLWVNGEVSAQSEMTVPPGQFMSLWAFYVFKKILSWYDCKVELVYTISFRDLKTMKIHPRKICSRGQHQRWISGNILPSANKAAAHSRFETQKTKKGVSVVPQQGLMLSKNWLKECSDRKMSVCGKTKRQD